MFVSTTHLWALPTWDHSIFNVSLKVSWTTPTIWIGAANLYKGQLLVLNFQHLCLSLSISVSPHTHTSLCPKFETTFFSVLRGQSRSLIHPYTEGLTLWRPRFVEGWFLVKFPSWSRLCDVSQSSPSQRVPIRFLRLPLKSTTRLVASNNRNLFSPISGGEKPQINMSAGPCSLQRL